MVGESVDGRYTEVASLLVLGVTFAALFLGVPNWWLGFVIGYGVVVPLVALLTGEDDEDEEEDRRVLDETDRRLDEASSGVGRGRDVPASKRDALETLRERYAQGELSEEQFEAKLERLLETETLEDARERVERTKRTTASADGATDDADGDTDDSDVELERN